MQFKGVSVLMHISVCISLLALTGERLNATKHLEQLFQSSTPPTTAAVFIYSYNKCHAHMH